MKTINKYLAEVQIMTKTVLITGANKGIGFETARQLGQQGWLVLLGARNPERGATAVKKLQAEGSQAELILIDLNDLTTIQAAAAKVAQEHPELRVLINNAGIAGDMQASPMGTKIAELQDTLAVNVVGNFAMIKAFAPILRSNHGRIVNLTIPDNFVQFFHPFSYITSKAGLNRMIKMFGLSFKRHHIPVEIFGVMPGGVSTDLNHHLKNPLMRSVSDGARVVVNLVNDQHNHQGKIVTDYGVAQALKRLVTKH